MLENRETPKAAAAAFDISTTTVRKWISRFRAERAASLQNQSSRPRHPRRRIPESARKRVTALRIQHWAGKQVAAERDIFGATVGHHLRFLKLSQMGNIGSRPAIVCYGRETAGEIPT